MENTVGLRIEKIQQWSSLSAEEFCGKIGVLRTQFYRYKHGDQQPNFKVLEKILREFPSVSSQWLMLGVGEMLIQKETERSVSVVSESVESYGHTPTEAELFKMLKGINESISSFLYKMEKRNA